MIETYLIVGNFLSLCCAICLGISVIKKDKKNLILWQVWDSIFGLLASVVLFSYASFTTQILCSTRNVLAYRKGLTIGTTILLIILCTAIGLWANNRGVIGLLPIIAFAGYTMAMYWSKNDQQMRYAVTLNLLPWFIHDWYIQAYPSAVMDIILSAWSFYQAMRRVSRKKRLNMRKTCLSQQGV